LYFISFPHVFIFWLNLFFLGMKEYKLSLQKKKGFNVDPIVNLPKRRAKSWNYRWCLVNHQRTVSLGMQSNPRRQKRLEICPFLCFFLFWLNHFYHFHYCISIFWPKIIDERVSISSSSSYQFAFASACCPNYWLLIIDQVHSISCIFKFLIICEHIKYINTKSNFLKWRFGSLSLNSFTKNQVFNRLTHIFILQ